MKKFFGIILVFIAVSLFSSCSKVIGYSVVLWHDENHGLDDGTIVPVYVKSNISHVYVISLPNSKEKFEIPLWKLSEPEKKSKAVNRAARSGDYKSKYAKCAVDGLPIRADKVNTSKQVYRLRKNEIVRTLYKGNGVAPTSGGKALEGEWLRVLTSDGTQGWCFSYNLRLFEMNRDGTYGEGAVEAEIEEKDELLEQIMTTKWYPDYYSPMIKSGEIDIDSIKTEYGFDTGYESDTVSIVLPNLNVSFDYSGVTKKEDRVYVFDKIPLELTIRNSRSIVLNYTNETGKPKSYTFVTLNSELNIEEIIQKEIERRQKLYKDIVALGPDFKSGNYGNLSFDDSGTFSWSGFSRLVPSVIAKGVKGKGTVSMNYFIPSLYQKEWDGIVTFDFEGGERELNFLYKKEDNGLRMTVVNVSSFINETTGRKKVTVTLPSNSIVLFFLSR